MSVCEGFPDDFSNWVYTQEKKSEEEIGNKEVKKEVSAEIPLMIGALKKLYRDKVRPLEEHYNYEKFASPILKDAYFDAKPFVMLVGQYSVGKTTFIRYLLERDFPGVRIGPEPTTDRFMCLMWGPNDRTIPGNALCADASRPFTQLQKYGMGFLNKFECAECDSSILKKISFIDTPGILSGEKQREGRGYDFPTMCEWFAGRCDCILLLFDAHKLDISDEMKATIERLRDNDEKISVVMNKADIPTQSLIRVYGALMWSLGKVFCTPEVLRVYIGSFWDQPLKNQANKSLLFLEQQDLLTSLRTLPDNVAIRKVNEVVKRAKKAQIHAQIMRHLKSKISGVTKKAKMKSQAKLLEKDNFMKAIEIVRNEHSIAKVDFPKLNDFAKEAATMEIWNIKKVNKKHDEMISELLNTDMPKLMSMLPNEKESGDESRHDPNNPFATRSDTALQLTSWCVSKGQKNQLSLSFEKLPLTRGKLLANDSQNVLKSMAGGLDDKVLFKVWALSDIDGDYALDESEYIVCCVLLAILKRQFAGQQEFIPDVLPDALIPSNKRHFFKKAGT